MVSLNFDIKTDTNCKIKVKYYINIKNCKYKNVQ